MKLSIVVAARNCPEFIDRLVTTLEGEDMDDAEIVISDDCSTDNTVEAAESSIAEAGLSGQAFVLRNRVWGHAGHARNEGLKASHGDWIWNFDADDVILKGAIPRIVAFLRDVRTDCDCVYLPHRQLDPGYVPSDHLAEVRMAPEAWRCAPWAKLVRRDVAERVPFRERHHFEDCDWWYACADVIRRPECLVGEPVCVYDRTTGGSMDGHEMLMHNRVAERYALWELMDSGIVGTSTLVDRLELLAALVALHRKVRRPSVRAAIIRLMMIMGDFTL